MTSPSRNAALKSIAAVLGLFLLAGLARAQNSDDELRSGISAYKNSRYEEALFDFRKAVELDSSNNQARMYLATTCMTQYIPGVDTPDNAAYANEAIKQYQVVLDSGESEYQANSAKGIAYLYLNMKRFNEARDSYQKALLFGPDDPEPHYSIGVIDWTASYQARIEARAKLKLKPEEHLNAQIPAQKNACDDLAAKYMKSIEDGMDSLNKAIRLRPDYDDAMAYMNLLYRERADLECSDPMARERDLKAADEWVDRTLEIKKQKAEKAGATAPNPQ